MQTLILFLVLYNFVQILLTNDMTPKYPKYANVCLADTLYTEFIIESKNTV
jgi:hypothetical protein